MNLEKNNFKVKYIKKQKDLHEMNEKPVFPRIVKIDTCNTCNFNCIFCPQSKQTGKVGIIDDKLCMKIIKDAFNAGAHELALSMTGEPLINKNLEKYIKYAKELGYTYVFINSNGLLCTEERAYSLINAGLDSIKFSVNASNKSYKYVHGQDCYNEVVQNIKNFSRIRQEIESNCKLYISYVATKYTLDEVEIVKNELKDYIDDFIALNANNRGGQMEEVDEELFIGNDEFSFTYPCSQLFNNAYVTSEGYLIACCQDFDNVMVMADLNTENIFDAWNNSTFTMFRKKYLNHDIKGTLCENCINNTHKNVFPINPRFAHYKISESKKKNLMNRIQQLKDQTNIN